MWTKTCQQHIFYRLQQGNHISNTIHTKRHKTTKYHLAADFVGGSKMYQLARLGWRGAALLVTAADIEFLSESAK